MSRGKVEMETRKLTNEQAGNRLGNSTLPKIVMITCNFHSQDSNFLDSGPLMKRATRSAAIRYMRHKNRNIIADASQSQLQCKRSERRAVPDSLQRIVTYSDHSLVATNRILQGTTRGHVHAATTSTLFEQRDLQMLFFAVVKRSRNDETHIFHVSMSSSGSM